MAGFPDKTADWLPQARAGSREALGQLLEACRAYLLMIARDGLDPDLNAKGGASDLVQETFLEAQRDFQGFQGSSETELLHWLRRLLLNNLANFGRHFRDTGKRQVQRELRLQNDQSSVDLGDQLLADTPSPSLAAISQERAQAVLKVLDRLPPDYRQVLTLRHQEEKSFEEIARIMHRTPNAVQKLWVRAVERMQLEMENGEW